MCGFLGSSLQMVHGTTCQGGQLGASCTAGLRREAVFYHEHDLCGARLGTIFDNTFQ